MSHRRLHICRPGTYPALSGREVTLTAADLAGCAAAYDRENAPAPLVIGHPKTDDPAFGWVADLAADAAGLTAGIEQVADELRDAVAAGRYRTLSASFFPPGHKRNPKPAHWYLRHVGFLGAAEPAVRGLARVELAAGDDDIETIDLGAPSPAITEPTMPDPTVDTVDTVDLAAARAEIDTERAKLAQQRAELDAERERLATAARAQQAAEIADFAAGVVRDQHYAPHVGETIRTVLVGVLGDGDTVDFGAPEDGADQVKLPPLGALKLMVSALANPANRIPQGEVTKPETVDLAAGDPEAKWAAEYAGNAKLQQEFSSAKTYAAYKRAESAGRVKLGNGLTQE